MTLSNSPSFSPRRRRYVWLWLAFGAIWFLGCGAALRADRPATTLARYCLRGDSLLTCTSGRTPGAFLVPPDFTNATRDLEFFLILGVGMPLLVFFMARAARWAAGGTDAP